MELEPLEIKTRSELQAVLAKLSAARLRKDIKIIEGSFDEHSIINVTFRVKGSGETWSLYCVNEGPSGNGYLRKA